MPTAYLRCLTNPIPPRRTEMPSLRHLSSLAFGATCLLLGACAAQEKEASATKSVTPAAVIDTVLSLEALPASALAALSTQAPTFTPYSASTFPPAFAARASRSRDEGLMVVRGDFEGRGRTDFALAGNDTKGLRVLVLFANADSGYRVVDIISEPQSVDTLRDSPNVVLARRSRPAVDGTGFDIEVWHAYDSPRREPEVWRWVPSRGQFLMVEGR